jgi:serine/threonine protein kinase
VSTGSEIPSELAGYRLERELGRGGISIVYLAADRFRHRVALKLLAPFLAEDESYRQRFLRGANWEAALEHPNIAAIYDAGEDKGWLYMVMRYVEGDTLKELIARDGPLPLDRTLFLLEQVASALDAAHEHGLIHCHVRPSNIIVAADSDHVFVTDFLLAATPASPGLRQTGFIGSPDYPSPEQIQGKPLDARTDVYALGSVFYECLTGSQPYEADSRAAVMYAHLSTPPPLLTAARNELPTSLDSVLAQAMAKSKQDRYATCSDFTLAARKAANVLETRPAGRDVAGSEHD